MGRRGCGPAPSHGGVFQQPRAPPGRPAGDDDDVHDDVRNPRRPSSTPSGSTPSGSSLVPVTVGTTSLPPSTPVHSEAGFDHDDDGRFECDHRDGSRRRRGRRRGGWSPVPRDESVLRGRPVHDGSCVGWAGSQGGSTFGLAAGARVLILDVERNEEIGRGTVESSRWEDVSGGGRQWNCFFDFTATVTGPPPAEYRIHVETLEPWLARPDPAAPDTFVASVNTDAAIGLIPSCPPVPEPEAEEEETASSAASTTSTTTTTRPRRFVSGSRGRAVLVARRGVALPRRIAGHRDRPTLPARGCRQRVHLGRRRLERLTVTYPDGAVPGRHPDDRGRRHRATLRVRP